ncbi:MAG: DNA-binding response regulator [Acidobacteria bacterium]|nr:MAG: DNA-binding response regulator [Acidobacteriota bacterium]
MGSASAGAPIRVMIVDDHGIVRDGVTLRLGLIDDLEVVGEAGSGIAALDAVPELAPDVVLMDIRMPDLDGIEATRQLKEALPEVKVVMLTTFDDRDYVKSAMDAGASGYLLKTAGADEIAAAVRTAHSGKVALDPGAALALVESMHEGERIESFDLSERELEVLTVLCEGKSNREIGATLHISPLTVKTHLQSIFQKLGAADRAQAVAIALRSGLVS